jgi:hypothetical protein
LDFLEVCRLCPLDRVVGVEVGGGFRVARLQELAILKSAAVVDRGDDKDKKDLFWLLQTIEARGIEFQETHPRDIFVEVESALEVDGRKVNCDVCAGKLCFSINGQRICLRNICVGRLGQSSKGGIARGPFI